MTPEDEKRKTNNWPLVVQINDMFYKYCETFLKIKEEFEIMSGENLRQIIITINRINLTPRKVKHVHGAPYRAVSEARELEKYKTDKMLGLKKIELTEL